MGGVETSRDGGATQETTKVVLVELTLNCSGGGRMPRWGKYKKFEIRIHMNKKIHDVQ